MRHSTPQAIPFLAVYNMLGLSLTEILEIAFGGEIVRKSEGDAQIIFPFHKLLRSLADLDEAFFVEIRMQFSTGLVKR